MQKPLATWYLVSIDMRNESFSSSLFYKWVHETNSSLALLATKFNKTVSWFQVEGSKKDHLNKMSMRLWCIYHIVRPFVALQMAVRYYKKSPARVQALRQRSRTPLNLRTGRRGRLYIVSISAQGNRLYRCFITVTGSDLPREE